MTQLANDTRPASAAGGAAREAVGRDLLSEPAQRYFSALFSKYRPSLFRFLAGLVSSSDDAAELVQESYARLLQQENITRLEAVGRTYLFQIATNLARDHFRRRNTRGVQCDVDDVPLMDHSDGPEQSIIWLQTIDAIKQGIKGLPPTTRRVFLLSRFRGKTYPQIAKLLGISTRTVERKMDQAMQALAVHLGERP